LSEGGEERLELVEARLEPAAVPLEDALAAGRIVEELGYILQRGQSSDESPERSAE